ncbi:endo-alpha-N-acetylgalactosaminidase family protein [Paenibacillus sp. CMAA1364]
MNRKKAFRILLTTLLGLQLCMPPAAIFAAESVPAYVNNYNTGDISGWTVGRGVATFAAENGAVRAATTGAVILSDQKSPALANGEYEVKLTFNEAPSRFGLVYRYVDSSNYNVIQYDAGSWGWDSLSNGTETYGNITSTNSPTFVAGQQYTFKLKFESDHVEMSIDGVSVLSTSLASLPKGAGKIGIRSWFTNKSFLIDDVKVNEVVVNNVVPRPITITDTLTSSDLTATIDREFPRVKKYTWNSTNAEMNGQINGFNELKINGKSYHPVATAYVKKAATATKGETASYTLQIPEINVNMNVDMELINNMLKFNVVSLSENGTEKVKTIEFPNHDLVSVIATEPKAQETAAWVTGEWNRVFEEYKDLKASATDVTGGRTYAFVNNDKLAATVITNVVNGDDKVRVKLATDTTLNTKKAAISGGAWTYRANLVLDPEPLPWAKVILTPDANNDTLVDWQDGAIVYRQEADAPVGSEMIRDNISYISMNIGSTTTSPFLRAFDNAKKISNLTDGFGQIVLYKGYQAEGHDDSHPDYGGHIGIRQGGVEDFNFVLSEGKKYNIKGGVHINATEYMTDAFEYKNENMNQPLSKGWGWLDQSYYVNKTKDVESGELKRRLDMLKDDTKENLSFVYVDVYAGADYNAKKLAEYINGNGWMLGTEFAGPLFEQSAWVHWGTDPGYPNAGNDSKIIRFLRNDVLDGFLTTPLLKGNKQVGVGYWQNSDPFYSYKTTTAAFFNHNLPTKYMQNFPIIKMEPNKVTFEDQVAVERQSDGKIHLSKDGKDIAIMTDSSSITNSTVFIPWDPKTEDKIYHWNPAGGATTWSLPTSWSNLTTVQLYKLNDLGREHVGSVPVTAGKVTLTAQQGIGYVLYKNTAPVQAEMVWGEGSPAKDNGFDSQQFNNWSKSSTGGTTDHVQFVKNSNADDQLQVKGPADATIQQDITGLVAGKTYSASAWVNIDGKRKVDISVKQGAEEVNNYLDNTEHKYLSQQHKYYNADFQRVKVSFDAKSDKALLQLKVDAGNAKVIFDDVRVWENPTKTETGNSVMFEDFENVDEGWGPFVYAKSGPVRTHLVEKAPAPIVQFQNYVLDDKWSLKTNEEGTGEWLRTLPHTLRLKEDNLYHLTMNYKSDELDMYTVAIRVKENGVVRDLASQKLKEGVNTLDIAFATEGAKDAYLAIIKNKVNNEKELTGTLVVDNIRVNDEGPIIPVEGTLVQSVTLSQQNIEMNLGQSVQINAQVSPANAFNRKLTWSSSHPEIVSVDQAGTLNATGAGAATITVTTTDGSNISATVSVNVFLANQIVPQGQMTASATSSQAGDAASNALDGNTTTLWHTSWATPHLPESITLNLGASRKVNQLNYTPRAGALNGTITKYNLYSSTNGVDFTLVTTGTWAQNDQVKKLRFPSVTATHLKLEATAGVGNYASAAEINVYEEVSTPQVIAVTGVQVDTTQITLQEGATAELTARLQPANATNKNVTWASSNNTIATVEVQNGRAIVTGISVGSADITVTTIDGNFTATSQVTVEKASVIASGTKLTAPATVLTNADFAVKLGLVNLTRNIYAQDFTVNYDSNVMDFIEAKSLNTGVTLFEPQILSPNALRFILASQGEANGMTGNSDVLEMSFRTKDLPTNSSGTISITKADIADDVGEFSVMPSSTTVNIEIPDQGIIGDITGDGKVSIGDLAIIAANYGKTASSSDWLLVKKADVNKDGTIGLEDLVIVAKKIVE